FTSNHDTVKFDNLDEFSGTLIPIHIAEEERIRREHANTDDVLPPDVENDDSDREVDVFDDLRVDNSILNSEHESSESEDSDFDNPSVPLPPLKPPDEEFDFEIDFGDEISVVRNTIVKFECIDARVVSNDENDDYSYFMFAKVFSLLFAESEDTIFDPDFVEIPIEIFFSKRSLRTIKFRDRVELTTRTKRGLKPQSLDSFWMKVLDNLTIHTPPSSLVVSFHLKDLYCYFHPCNDDPKKHYGSKPGLLGYSGSLGVDFLKLEMIDDDWGLESKKVYFLGRGLISPIWPKK
nr:hypothetical protein [Tanacetum cinerariifolium]